jgi:hypothetical protein
MITRYCCDYSGYPDEYEQGDLVRFTDHVALIREARDLAHAVMMLHEKHGSTDYGSYATAKAFLDKTKEGV